jgi:O-antigen ligase
LVALKAYFVAAAYVAYGYLYFLSTPCTPVRRKRWVLLASVLAGLFGLYGALRVLVQGIGLRAAYGAARPFFTEHGTYAAFLALLAPIPLFEALERTGRARWGYASAAFAAGLGITLSFTRAAWISVVIVVPLALIVWARHRRSVRRLILPAALGLSLAGVLVSLGAGQRLVRHAETVVQAENVSNLERVNRWMAAWGMARDHPLIGVGYGAYPDAYPAYRRKAIVTELTYGHFGAHSEPLRLLAEMGWPGLAVGLGFVVAVVGVGLRTFHRAVDPGAARLALALAAGLAAYAVHGVFNSYLGIDKVSAPFWLATGAIAALAASPASRPGCSD